MITRWVFWAAIACLTGLSSAAQSQAWRNCIPGSIGPGGCDSIGPGGGQSIGPGGGMSIGPGGPEHPQRNGSRDHLGTLVFACTTLDAPSNSVRQKRPMPSSQDRA
jgi:hypothetical protein